MNWDENFSMYGISQSPFGKISTLYVKDILELADHENTNKGVIDEFVSESSSVNKAIKSLQSDMATPLQRKEGQTIGGGSLFRVKRKTNYRSKYM